MPSMLIKLEDGIRGLGSAQEELSNCRFGLQGRCMQLWKS